MPLQLLLLGALVVGASATPAASSPGDPPRVRVSSVLASTLASTPARVPPDQQPLAPGTDPVRIDYQSFVLPNGLTVLVYPDSRVPTVFVGLWYRVGSKDEPPGRTGFAHLFEHLMFQETANRKGEYFTLLRQAGATDINASTTRDYTEYHETVPTNALDLALWMESDRMGYLAGGLTQARLDEQRAVVKNEKRQREAEPSADLAERFDANFYPPGHPYRHTTIGSMADLDAASLADVKQWFDEKYGAANAVLVLAGDISAATARDKVARYFGAIRPGTPIDGPTQWTPTVEIIRRDVIHAPVGAASLSRTWPLSNDDPRAMTLLQLAALAMTSSDNAPLARILVGERHVATAISTSVERNALSSLVSINMGLAPDVTPEQAGKALDAAIARVLATGIDVDRLRAIVGGTDASTLRQLESAATIGSRMIEGEVTQRDPLFFLRQRRWIADATPAEVNAVAARWLAAPYQELAVLPTPVFAATGKDVDRSAPPTPGPLKTTITFPPITRMTLANGLKIVLAERHQVPIVEASMQFPTGSAADAHDALGVATLAFNLMTAGSVKYPPAVLEREVARTATTVATMPAARRSGFSWSAPTRNLDGAFALAADLLRHPLYLQTDIDRVAGAAERRDRARRGAPATTVGGLFSKALWGADHPEGMLPQPGAGRAITRDELLRFHDREIGPDDATLFLIGDLSPAEARRLADRFFGDWAPVAAKPIATPPLARGLKNRIILVDVPGAQQSMVMVGNVAPPFDPALGATETLLDAALDGGFESRLNMNLREAKGWSYGFSGGIDGGPVGQRVSAASGAVQADRTAQSMAEIRREITDFVSTRPITQAELDDNRGAALRAISSSFGTSSAYLGAMIDAAGHGQPLDRAATAADRLSAVTLEQARRLAPQIYKPDELVWIVAGDLRTIEQPIRALGIAPIEIWSPGGDRLR